MQAAAQDPPDLVGEWPSSHTMIETSSSESKPQLELNPARGIVLCSDLGKVRTIDVCIRALPMHVIQSVDEFSPDLHAQPFRQGHVPGHIHVQLVHEVLAQPVESPRRDAAVERIRLEVRRSYVLVGARSVTLRAADVSHLL